MIKDVGWMNYGLDSDLIYQLADEFRNMIESALDSGVIMDSTFRNFPIGCCGEASDLLGQYLLDHGIQTWYVCGTCYTEYDDVIQTNRNLQSHAWLTTDDPFSGRRYLIIDITGDQFWNNELYGRYDIPVYVGEMDDFHSLFPFEKRDVSRNVGLNGLGGSAQARLWMLYKQIMQQNEDF